MYNTSSGPHENDLLCLLSKIILQARKRHIREIYLRIISIKSSVIMLIISNYSIIHLYCYKFSVLKTSHKYNNANLSSVSSGLHQITHLKLCNNKFTWRFQKTNLYCMLFNMKTYKELINLYCCFSTITIRLFTFNWTASDESYDIWVRNFVHIF